MTHLEYCPECGCKWKGEDILEYFLRLKREGDPYWGKKTREEIRESAGDYGWKEEEPKWFSRLIGVELPYDDPGHYDGVSFWKCPDCETQWDRFTGEKACGKKHSTS